MSLIAGLIQAFDLPGVPSLPSPASWPLPTAEYEAFFLQRYFRMCRQIESSNQLVCLGHHSSVRLGEIADLREWVTIAGGLQARLIDELDFFARVYGHPFSGRSILDRSISVSA